jgi:hypothetical protein
MSEPTLDWSTAEVKDSTLTVQVDGDLPDGWADTFNTTVKLLGGGSWGEIKLEEQQAEVNGLMPGTEDKLRHFLESVVQQANASHASDDDEDDDDDQEEGEDQEGDEDSGKESGSDKEMADQFKSFAEGDDSDEDDSDKGDDSGGDDDSEKKGRSKKKGESKDDDSDEEEDSDDDSSE